MSTYVLNYERILNMIKYKKYTNLLKYNEVRIFYYIYIYQYNIDNINVKI